MLPMRSEQVRGLLRVWCAAAAAVWLLSAAAADAARVSTHHVRVASLHTSHTPHTRHSLHGGGGGDGSTAPPAPKPVLRFRDGKFRVVQFTDLHIGMRDNTALDQQTVDITRTILRAEQPDLVVFTGDAVMNDGGNCSTGWLDDHWPLVTQACREQRIPWAWVSGNHDDEYCSHPKRDEIAAHDALSPLSLTRVGPTGVSYLLPVFPELHDSVVPAAHLWLFDSGNYNCERVPGYGCVTPETVEWYRDTAKAAATRYNKTVPALSFMHIPPPEFMQMWNRASVMGSFFQDNISCWSVNSGLYSVFREIGDVRLLTVGHDHDNDWGGDFFGVQLYYGRKTGYGCYGPPSGFLSGARVFELTEEPFTIDTWMRLDDGSKHVPAIPHDSDPSTQQDVCQG